MDMDDTRRWGAAESCWQVGGFGDATLSVTVAQV